MTTSIRYPFELPGQPKEVQQAHRFAFDAIKDLNDANAYVKTQLDSITAQMTSVTTAATVSTTTAASTGTVATVPGVQSGTVNNQTGATSYTTQQSDNGALVILSSASPVAASLASGMTMPYYLFAFNNGAGLATLTPSSGTINGAANHTIAQGSAVIVFLDGSGNWWSEPISKYPQTIAAVASKWVNSYTASTGAFTATQPTSADVIPASGATAARPTAHAVGQTYFDTSLGVPIWWSGSNWVNASGSTV